MKELEKNELMKIEGGKWWFVALGFATCGVLFMADFVNDMCDGRPFDCEQWDS